MASQLPIYKINNKFYFLDKRLNEYRNVENPDDVLKYFDITINDLQQSTFKDIEYLNNMGVI